MRSLQKRNYRGINDKVFWFLRFPSKHQKLIGEGRSERKTPKPLKPLKLKMGLDSDILLIIF